MDIINNTFITVGNTRYFIKRDDRNNKSEIIAERLANIAGINCAHYEYQYINDIGYYFSEDLASLGKFSTADDLGLSREEIYLYKIWDFFEKKYPLESIKLTRQFVKAFLFNFFILNPDLHSGNWGLVEDKDGNNNVYIFDNEMGFNLEESHYITSEFYEGKPEIKHNYRDSSIRENMKNLELFIKVSDSSFNSLLVSMYEVLTPEVFFKIIGDIDREYGINKNDVQGLKWLYNLNYNEIGNLLKKYKLIDEPSLK